MLPKSAYSRLRSIWIACPNDLPSIKSIPCRDLRVLKLWDTALTERSPFLLALQGNPLLEVLELCIFFARNADHAPNDVPPDFTIDLPHLRHLVIHAITKPLALPGYYNTAGPAAAAHVLQYLSLPPTARTDVVLDAQSMPHTGDPPRVLHPLRTPAETLTHATLALPDQRGDVRLRGRAAEDGDPDGAETFALRCMPFLWTEARGCATALAFPCLARLALALEGDRAWLARERSCEARTVRAVLDAAPHLREVTVRGADVALEVFATVLGTRCPELGLVRVEGGAVGTKGRKRLVRMCKARGLQVFLN
ncbi:uncharacterized protein BXZ73DRAFT_95352 [Epithele typhae]|uniref:uncharacterized protein n=1 Tax=Epithele typhae TaxID=378194 RepID=UPI00200731FB|nr:uncharacterized protein BXZ73DRAFT_95352 [Epithele typhae]KAH9945831.1 hypothetical protein BXZ73DRAFT_95352 [Epithele typhae]